MKTRFNIVKESKFETLTDAEMSSVQGGGICFSCRKREKKIEIGVGKNGNGQGDKSNTVHAESAIQIKIN